MNTLRIAALSTLALVTACEGFKDAMTAHVDVAARAAGQQLTVHRLSDLMAKTPQIPLRKDVAKSIADVWVNYQLLAKAAANNDSLSNPALIDSVMKPLLTNSRRNKWMAVVSQTWPNDTTNLEQKYNEGELLAASHILFQVPTAQQSTGSDSIRRKAEGVLKQTTAANFAALAKKYGSDGTKDRGGSLGVFPHGWSVPAFEQAVAALKPGQIGPLVQTQFGYHIVRRPAYSEVKDAFRAAHDSLQRVHNESTYVAAVEHGGKVQLKPGAAKTTKEVAADVDGHRDDKTVLATSLAGTLTAAEVARFISAQSPQQQEQLKGWITTSADSIVPNFVKFLVRDELFLRQADSAKVSLDTSEVASIRQAFRMTVVNTWAGLRIAPEMLADSAKTTQEKERLAASRVDAYLDRLLAQQEQYVEVQPPLANALREKYDGSVNAAGLDRAVQAAQKVRAAADSARAAQQPKSAVPMPTVPPPDTSAKGGATKKG